MADKKTHSILKGFIRPGDVLVILMVLILAAISFYGMVIRSTPGGEAIVTTPDGTLRWDLSQNMEKTITGNGDIQLTLEIAEGRIRFRESQCPDNICVGSGWLSRTGQTAACLPAGISIRISSGENHDFDAVAE